MTEVLIMDKQIRQHSARIAHRGTATAPGKKTKEELKEEIVFAINRYRACHKVNPLIRNRKIEREHSDPWAKKIVQTDQFSHSDDDKFGENIYAGELTTGFDPVDVWYWENNFNYNDPERSLTAPGCGHFTAMVWKETTEVGVGIQPYHDEDENHVVVVSFYPPGNVMGAVARNVIRPRSRVRRRRI